MAVQSVYPGEVYLREGLEDEAISVNGDQGDALHQYTAEDDQHTGAENRQGIRSVQIRASQASDYPVSAFLNDLRTVAQNLRISQHGMSARSELHAHQESPAAAGAVIAGASLAFNVLSSAVATLQQGDLQVTMPTSEIGVTASNLPPSVRLNTRTINNRVVFSYREANPISGIEQVNIKLTCTVQYNGPEVKATFGFTPDGARSRLMRDSTINIRNPLNLQTMPAPAAWVSAGVREYPVVIVPIEIRVDRPWPQANANFSFNLVLSGMYGLGRSAGSSYRENFVRRDN